MFDLFQFDKLICLPSKYKIVFSCVHESSCGVTIVANVGHEYLLCYHVTNDNQVIIKHISLNTHVPLKWMCLDETGGWLCAINGKSTIFLIPISQVIASKSDDVLLDYDASIITACTLNSPTCMIWWKSLDGLSEIAIVGNDAGEISFIDLKSKCEIGGTYVPHSISELAIIKDRFAMSLLINCSDQTQWRLTLEETAQKRRNRDRGKDKDKASEDGYDESYERHRDKHESVMQQNNYYLGCFLTSQIDKEIGPKNCWNAKPRSISFSREASHQGNRTMKYENPFVIVCTSNSLVDGIEEEAIKCSVKIMPCDDFNYDLSSVIAEYSLPNICLDPLVPSHILLTERMLIISNRTSLVFISKEFANYKKKKSNSLIQEIKLSDHEEIINVFKCVGIESELSFNSFIIVTSHGIYKCYAKHTCQDYFVSLVTSSHSLASSAIKAQRFASMMNMNASLMYVKAARHCLDNKQIAKAISFYHIAKTPQLTRVTSMLSKGYINQVIEYITFLLSNKLSELEESERLQLSNIVVKCHISLLSHKKDVKDEEKSLKAFKTLLKDNIYYDERIALELLVGGQLFELAHYCAHLRMQFDIMLEYLLKFNTLLANQIGGEIFERIAKSELKEALLPYMTSDSYLDCMSSPELTYALILRRDLINNYLLFIIRMLPSLKLSHLTRIAFIFDPRRATTKLLNRMLAQSKYDYLSYNQDEQILMSKDILNIFILVFLMILREGETISKFDERFMTIDVNNLDEKQKVKTLKSFSSLESSIAIHAGQSHSAFISDGCLFMWGKSQFGCVGVASESNLVKENISHPTLIELFKSTLSISVRSVSCGSKHTLVLTDFGVYAFGSNSFGQCGLGSDVIMARNAILIDELIDKDVIKVTCGQYHSLAITSNGHVYSWGWGVHGQLGHGDTDNIYVPRRIEAFKDISVTSACAGQAHTIILTCDGDVYSFGNGTYGQLGLGSTEKSNIPQKITLISSPVKLISSSYYHSLALTQDKKLYEWGSNPQTIRLQAQQLKKSRMNNQLSSFPIPQMIEQNQLYLSPTLVDTNSIAGQIMKISTGISHSLLLTSDGHVFSYGRGLDGQLGLGRGVKEAKSPTMIVALNDKKMIEIGTGSDYSFAVDDQDQVWGWGCNGDEQLGSNQLKNCDQDDKNKRITIRTSKRVFTLNSRGKYTEFIPVKVNISQTEDLANESLNYSLNINAMNSHLIHNRLEDNMMRQTLSNHNCDLNNFDISVLASVLTCNHRDLDLANVLQRCLSFNCFQMAAFVYELQNDNANALNLQLRSLENSFDYHKDSNLFISYCTQIFSTFISKSLDSLNDGIKVIDIFIANFWLVNKFDVNSLQELLINCFSQHVKDGMFGIVFFSYLNQNENVKEKFSTSFLLNMADLTIKNIAKSPQKLFLCQSTIEQITSHFENAFYSTENEWQNILSKIDCPKSGLNTAIEVDATESEIILFTCKHHYGMQQFRDTLLPNIKKQLLLETNEITQSFITNLISLFDDASKQSWKTECPKCLIKKFKTNSSVDCNLSTNSLFLKDKC